MSNQAPNDVLLFTKCSNLNTDPCLYGKSPELILSLFSDPENFVIDNQGVQESFCKPKKEKIRWEKLLEYL